MHIIKKVNLYYILWISVCYNFFTHKVLDIRKVWWHPVLAHCRDFKTFYQRIHLNYLHSFFICERFRLFVYYYFENCCSIGNADGSTLVSFQSSSMKAGFSYISICALIVISVILLVFPCCLGVPIVGGRIVSSSKGTTPEKLTLESDLNTTVLQVPFSIPLWFHCRMSFSNLEEILVAV